MCVCGGGGGSGGGGGASHLPVDVIEPILCGESAVKACNDRPGVGVTEPNKPY